MFEKTRVRFFCGHLLISLIVAMCILGWVFFIWYPYPLAKAVDVTHIFLMLIIIDIILGPLIGYAIYKKGKKTLKMDLCIIVVVQIIALIYGIYNLEKGRPVWIVYTGNNFDLVRKNELVYKDRESIEEKYKRVGWFKPQFVAAEYSRDDKKKYVEMFQEMNSGATRAQMPHYYKNIGTAASEIKYRARSLQDLYKYNNKDLVDMSLDENKKATAWLPLITYGLNMVVLLDKKTGAIINIVDLRPEK
ncbi:TfpX/TfpZ family type IV pilin accessory protein [Acinetobacter haemolyticus]|uniref:Type IV pilin accessory protein n=1 Tax=Acinetobacter haemolyticus TaxID=29430 RepID=A0A4V1ASC7_ACIHA|nr:TfpX/TfpZ family type IV pilin accessory protein [Acinetobacter haemolyticus]QBQ15039.1 type IV pilin accessory protein [Acinetobacter haemolyticus]